MPAKTALAWFVSYWGLLFMSFARSPVYGVLAYLLEYYLRPSLQWWGDELPALRYNLIAASVILISYLMRRSTMPELSVPRTVVTRLLLAFGTLMILVSPFAVNTVESWDTVFNFWKYVAFYLLVVAILRSDWALNAFITMHVMGATYWGWEAYRDPARSESRLLSVGSGDTLNDNQAAGHLLTVLPFAVLLIFTAKKPIGRAFAVAATLLIVNVFILCNSRGATVGLVVALLATIVLARRRHRLRMIGASIGMAALVLMLADPEFITRQQTTLNYQEESTAQSRLNNWDSALRMLRDYPLGAGGFGYNTLSPRYVPELVANRSEGQISPHNTWILISAEWGIPGLTLFLGFIGSAFVLLHRIRRETQDGAIYYRSLAIQIGLIGTLAAATFSDRLYGESIYWLAALAVVAYRIHAHGMATQRLPVPVDPSAAGVPAAAGAVIGRTA